MEIDPYKLWELVIKSLTMIGAIVAAVWAYHTYTDTKEKEFYSVFWNTKLTLFLETSSAASTMATAESLDEFNKARTKYWELFFGRLSLVEGEPVKKAMESFSKLVPVGPVEQTALPLKSMQQPAYRLTLALKEELGHAWQRPFGEL
jgi:hypothetical protein